MSLELGVGLLALFGAGMGALWMLEVQNRRDELELEQLRLRLMMALQREDE